MTNRRVGFIILALSIALAGCVAPKEALKGFLGISTDVLEETRGDALVKVFHRDYGTCYKGTLHILKKMPKASVYSKDSRMIALYYIDPNATPVGIFFKKLDPAHTEVEVSSPARGAKEIVAQCIFSGKISYAASSVSTKSDVWRK